MVQSLCNACGIRQRKARRAMADAAAAAANGTSFGTEASSPLKVKLPNKEKKMHTSNAAQHKKLCKPYCPPPTKKMLCFDDFTSSLSKNSGFRRVFPQDEEEAAILLMALSCDHLVYSWLLINNFQLPIFFWIIINVLCVESEMIICFTIANLEINIIEVSI